MGTVGTLGSVTATFTADVDNLVSSTDAIGKQFDKTGDQAEQAAQKIKAAGEATDRAAKMQEAAVERARRAWQRELQAQDQRIEKEREVARAKELAALKSDILTRSETGLGEALGASIPKTAAASGALRVLEGNVTNNIRAAERFLGTLPAVSALLEKAFPVVGAIALAGVVYELAERFGQFVTKNIGAAGAITQAMENVQQSTRMSTHEIELSNAKLDEQIAKLEHKPMNALELALAQGRVEADRLTRSLNDVADAAQKALEANEVSFLGGAVTGQGPSGAASDMAKDNADAIKRINAKYDEMLDSSTSMEDFHKVEKDRNAELSTELARQRDAAAAKWNELHKAQADFLATGAPLAALGPELQAQAVAGGNGKLPADQTANMAAYGTMGHQAQEQLRQLSDSLKHTEKQSQADKDEKARQAEEQGRQAALKRMQAYRNELERVDDGQLDDRSRFWESKLALEKKGSQNYLEIQAELAKIARKYYEEGDKRDAEYDKIKRGVISDSYTQLEPKDTKAQTDTIMARLEAMKSIQVANEQAAESQALWNISMAESTGVITKQQAAVARDAISVGKLQEQLERQKANFDIAMAHPELWTAKFNPEMFSAQMAQTNGQLSQAQNKYGFDQDQSTFAGEMRTMFDEWIEKATDLRGQMSQFWGELTSGVNNDLVKMLTDPRQQRQHMWSKTGKDLFTDVTKSGLNYAEGSVMKGLGLGGLGKLGTRGNPMFVKSADSLPTMPSSLGGAATAAGGAGLPGGFMGLLGAAAPFAGFLADGGPVSPGNYVVGERGPELLNIGGSGYMHSNASLRSAAGAGTTHHHTWHVDARGAHDPVAVRAAVDRGINAAAPRIAAAAIAGDRDMRSRRPASSQ
jgi:hypothetical protein